jgi:hypothetical protein
LRSSAKKLKTSYDREPLKLSATSPLQGAEGRDSGPFVETEAQANRVTRFASR